MNQGSFVFGDYHIYHDLGQINFDYRVVTSSGEEYNFCEKIIFPKKLDKTKADSTIFREIIKNLHLILGISYYKAFCPGQIITEKYSLTKEQADFFNTVYTRGLGEFFYKNKIDFRGLINFPYNGKLNYKSEKFNPKNRSLLAIGGGKDSLVSMQMLESEKHEFSLFNFSNTYVSDFADNTGIDQIYIERVIDPKLLDLNKSSAVYNGHVPVSAIYAFMSFAAAYLYDYKYLIFSNERSASFGNLQYLSETVNHQWSKSEEFENLFRKYVSDNLCEGIIYFSLLRPIYEIEVVRRFIEFGKYFNEFTSCNRNFSLDKKHDEKWCGRCAKCAFVFALFSAYLDEQIIIGIFGQNFFESKYLFDTYKSLIGLKPYVKPFDCVGTPEETIVALYMALQRGIFTESRVMNFFKDDILPRIDNIEQMKAEVFDLFNLKNIPESFRDIYSQ